MTGQMKQDIILQQHIRQFRCAMDVDFVFMDENTCSRIATIVADCLEHEDITHFEWLASPDLNLI
ncbi:hypothetical protein AVEN_56509-1, partial [Araneus ventricosus]